MGDDAQISQVFSNLVDNAIKYRRPDRQCRIHVSATPKSRSSVYYVDDNGHGIAPAHRDKAFEVFHRLHPGAGIQGEGLGLAIVRRIVDKHNGEVRVEASPEGGCRFVVTLPAPRLTEIRDGTQRVFHAGIGNREKP